MFFVFYEDGYCDNGDVGIKKCDNKEQAEKFVLQRLINPETTEKRSIKNYVVIEGKEVQIRIIKEVSKIKIGD